MRKGTLLAAAAVVAIALAGCETMTPQERQVTGGLVGATAALVTANALNASAGWTLLTVLTGATVGTLVARNERTGQCAYARGNGRYLMRPCTY